MIIVYTGEGKGKTCACVGQAIRAYGQGLRVVFGQFMKRPALAGEQRVLDSLLAGDYFACGKGFFRDERDRAGHLAAANELLEWIEERIDSVDMLVLDEALYALGKGLLERSRLEQLVNRAKTVPFHLVLSGRGMPLWLEEMADLVTVLEDRKHPYSSRVQARPGIDY